MLNWVAEPAAGQAAAAAVECPSDIYNVLSRCKTPVLLLLQISEYNAAQGVLNWVAEPAAGTAPPRVELRLYDVLLSGEDPAGAEDWLADLNPKSLEVVCDALASPPLVAAQPGDRCEILGILPFLC